jgi:hypothetical protein
MATTTNYGWTTPDDTALVKDGAAAIRTLGSSVDTTTKNLNPETTLGDIAYRSSSANVKTRLGIGATAQVLTVASGVPSWATPNQLTFNAQTGTTYTLVAADLNKLVTTSNASAVTVTIPASTFNVGDTINIQSIGVGLTTISGGAVTITSTGASASAPILRARYSAASIICTASNVFTIVGDLS